MQWWVDLRALLWDTRAESRSDFPLKNSIITVLGLRWLVFSTAPFIRMSDRPKVPQAARSRVALRHRLFPNIVSIRITGCTCTSRARPQKLGCDRPG